jgi:hypothetical protein
MAEQFSKERDRKQRQLDVLQADVTKLTQAVEHLRGAAQLDTVWVVDSGRTAALYAGLGIQEAAARWLREMHNVPQETKTIADMIRSRGITTRARKFTQVVYTSLQESGRFVRTQDKKWALKEERDRGH